MAKPHVRDKGRKGRREVCEFGESILYMPADALDQPNMQPRWLHGLWLGLRPESDEVLVGTTEGVFKARSIKRKPYETRWSHEQITSMRGTPWRPCPHLTDDSIRIKPPTCSSAEPPRATESEASSATDPIAPRRLRIERRDLEKVGYTPGCPGCYAARHRRPHKSHTGF